jgi:hypothetical protein
LKAVAKGKMSIPVSKPSKEWMLSAMIDWIAPVKIKELLQIEQSLTI